MTGFQLQRLGLVMEPERGNPLDGRRPEPGCGPWYGWSALPFSAARRVGQLFAHRYSASAV